MENITADYKKNYITTNSFNLTALQTNIGAESTSQNNSYGQYKVTENHFIKFVSQAETPIITGNDPKNLLKVTVKDNTTNESLTALFSDPTVTLP